MLGSFESAAYCPGPARRVDLSRDTAAVVTPPDGAQKTVAPQRSSRAAVGRQPCSAPTCARPSISAAVRLRSEPLFCKAARCAALSRSPNRGTTASQVASESVSGTARGISRESRSRCGFATDRSGRDNGSDDTGPTGPTTAFVAAWGRCAPRSAGRQGASCGTGVTSWNGPRPTGRENGEG
jgi:hypothetical protein